MSLSGALYYGLKGNGGWALVFTILFIRCSYDVYQWWSELNDDDDDFGTPLAIRRQEG